MRAQRPVPLQMESSALLTAGRQSYSYVQISDESSSIAASKLCRKCNNLDSQCQCERNVGNSGGKNSPYKFQSAQRSLLVTTVFLSLIIIGSALLFRHYNVPSYIDKNPLMMSVFLDNESTSRFEVVDNTIDIVRGRRTKRVLASGTYVKNANSGGWNHLTVRAGEGFSSSPSIKAHSQETSVNYIRSMEAAGYLEGFATCTEVGQYYVNFYFGLFDGGDPTEGSLEFLEDNYDWMSSEAEKNWETSDYWLAVKGLLAQLTGLLDGIKEGCPSFSHIPGGDSTDNAQHHRGVYLPSLTRNPSLIHLLLLNANGDLYQISDKYSQKDSSPTTDDSDDEVNYPFRPSTSSRRSGRNPGSGSGSSSSSTSSSKTAQSDSKASTVFPRNQNIRGNLNDHSIRTKNILQEDIVSPREASAEGSHGIKEEMENSKQKSKGRKLSSKSRRSRGGEVEGSGSRSEGVDHCSALLKFIPDKGGDKSKNDLIIGHNTWDDFQCAGPRIFKHYSLPLITGFIVPETFSSGYNAGTVVPGENENTVNLASAFTGRSFDKLNENKNNVVEVDVGDVSVAEMRSEKSIEFQGAVGSDVSVINAPPRDHKDKEKRKGNSKDEDDTYDDYNADNRNQDVNSPGDDDDSQSRKNNNRLEMHFSSSPGLLSSVDDFFTLSGRGEFVVLETTMDVYNDELLQYIRPDTILSWTRCRLSNQLAATGAEWAEVFSMYHSGTYANQWMVVDLTRFRPGADPLYGLLTVLEEIPGYMHSADLTSHLVEKGYWGSYNNPYFDDISELSGNKDICEKNVNTCYETDPRALLFQKHQGGVVDVLDMQRILGLNEFSSDPIALNDSCNAIACRQDLEPDVESRYPFGALDGKVTSARLLMTAKAYDQKARVRALNTVMDGSDGSSTSFSTSSLLRSLEYSEADASSESDGDEPGNDDESWNEYFTSENRTEAKVTFKNRKTEEIKKHQRAASRPPHAMARMGPSNSADGMPAFCWKEFSRNRDKRGKVFSHQGQPDCFDFPWVAMPPALFV